MANLENNLKRVNYLNFWFMFFVIMPVIVPFFKARGLSMENIYQLQAVFSFCVLVLEVPSGYISDLFGRKHSLTLAAIFSAIGFTIFPFTDSFVHLVIAEFFLAIASSLYSGTDTSLIYDTMKELGDRRAEIKILGQKVFYGRIGETVASLVGGGLAIYSLDLAAYVNAAVSWIPVFVCLGLVEPKRELMDKKTHKENISYIWKSLFGHSHLLTLVILNGIAYSVATLIAVWAYQEYWKSIGVALGWFGFMWAIQNLSVALIAKRAHKVEKALGSTKTILLMGILPIIGFFSFALVKEVWGAALFISFACCRGITRIVLTDALNKRVSSDLRATANSIQGLGTRLLFIVLGPAAGYLMDNHGQSFTFTAFGSLYIIIFFILLLPLLKQKENFIPIKSKKA